MKISGTDIYITRGDSGGFVYKQYLKNTDGSMGELVPLEEGDTVYFTVKKSGKDSANLLQKVITEFTPEGTAEIPIDPEDTKPLDFKTYKYDLQVTDRFNRVRTVIKQPGPRFIVGEEITHE